MLVASLYFTNSNVIAGPLQLGLQLVSLSPQCIRCVRVCIKNDVQVASSFRRAEQDQNAFLLCLLSSWMLVDWVGH